MALPISPYLSTIRAVKIRYRGMAARSHPFTIFWPHIFPPIHPKGKISQQIFKVGEGGLWRWP